MEQPGENLPLVMDLVVDGLSMDTARRRHKLGWEKAMAQVISGLEEFSSRWEQHQALKHQRD